MTADNRTPAEFYSDAALAKQAAANIKRANGEKLTWDDMAGIYQSRIAPTAAERCCCCQSDARDGMGGEEHHGVRWCDIGREHHIDPDPETVTDGLAAKS